MAPGIPFAPGIPLDREIKEVVFKMLKDKLTLTCLNTGYTTIIQIMLGKVPIGKAIELDLHFRRDSGHSGESYATRIESTEIEPI